MDWDEDETRRREAPTSPHGVVPAPRRASPQRKLRLTVLGVGCVLTSLPLVAAALKFRIVAAATDSSAAGLFLMPLYLLVPFVAAFSVLLRWCCGGTRVCCCRKRRHILRLRQAVLIGVLGGLVHVLVMVAVVTLPLLTALLLSSADALWNTLRVGFFGGSKAKATAADDHDGNVPDILLPSAGTSMLAVFVPVTFGAAVALVIFSDASASPLGLACAGTASVLRPLYAALCRRAINSRCSRESIAKWLPLPINNSHRFVGFDRGHLDLLDRLHTHPGFASSVVGLDGPSTFELVLLTECLWAFVHATWIVIMLHSLKLVPANVHQLAQSDDVGVSADGALTKIPIDIVGSLVDLVFGGAMGVCMVLHPWLKGKFIASAGTVPAMGLQLLMLLVGGLGGTAAVNTSIPDKLGGGLMCFVLASVLLFVLDSRRYTLAQAKRLVSDLAATRDVTLADVNTVCGPRGLLTGTGCVPAGHQLQTLFGRIVRAGLEHHAAKPRSDPRLVGLGGRPDTPTWDDLTAEIGHETEPELLPAAAVAATTDTVEALVPPVSGNCSSTTFEGSESRPHIGTVGPEPEPESESEPESLAEPESRPLPVDGTGEIDPGEANGEKEEKEGRPNARRRRASTELREHLAASLRRQLDELAEAARTVRLDEDGVPIGLRELFPKAPVKHTTAFEKQLREVFNKCDTDGNGSIDSDELLTVLLELRQPATKETAEELMTKYGGADREIDFDEFSFMVSRTEGMRIDIQMAARITTIAETAERKNQEEIQRRKNQREEAASARKLKNLDAQAKQRKAAIADIQHTVAKEAKIKADREKRLKAFGFD